MSFILENKFISNIACTIVDPKKKKKKKKQERHNEAKISSPWTIKF